MLTRSNAQKNTVIMQYTANQVEEHWWTVVLIMQYTDTE